MGTLKVLLSAMALLVVQACSPVNNQIETTDAEKAFEKQLIKQLVMAKSGDVIEIPEGLHPISRGLSLNVDGVTIRGKGMNKSILSFKGQIAGAEGLLVNANDFTIEDLALEDTRGDALKVNEAQNVIIRRVRTEWTNGPDEKNGAYGIYPVQTQHTLIDGAVAIAASDAGIYVGQSKNVIVRNSRAEYNVAGIEIENTQGADVYNNIATNNTGGILVFNMPNLPQPGFATRVFNNKVVDNNTANFAAKGTAVAGVPAGSGVVINSNDKVEIFNNVIGDNDTANVIVSSYYSASFYSDKSTADAFDPYPETIYIYDNEFGKGGNSPDLMELQALRVAEFGIGGSLPDVLWDGYVNPEKSKDGVLFAEHQICINNGAAGIVNVDAANGYKNISTDIKPHQCQHEKLPAVVLPEYFNGK
ncbi:parallel beta-helix domain-containing protein [Alteromonadaceae bacterium BrNp21-10]|nr:parallel beta-helix domain-containing protein [Alteromonadaceae bacterium BrNp21-10]